MRAKQLAIIVLATLLSVIVPLVVTAATCRLKHAQHIAQKTRL